MNQMYTVVRLIGRLFEALNEGAILALSAILAVENLRVSSIQLLRQVAHHVYWWARVRHLHVCQLGCEISLPKATTDCSNQ